MKTRDGDWAIVHAKKETVRKVRCPRCKAKRDQPCVEPDGQERHSNHEQRVKKYISHWLSMQGQQLVPVESAKMSPEEREAYRAQVRALVCRGCGAEPNERCRSRRPEGRASCCRERTADFRRELAGSK